MSNDIENTKPNIYDRISRKLKKRGLDAKDIPSGLILLSGLGWIEYITTFAICYKLKPLQRLVKLPLIRTAYSNLKIKYSNFYNKVDTYVKTKTLQASKNKYFKKIPKYLGLKSITFVEAFCENMILYHLIAPFVIIYKINLVIWIINKYKNMSIK